jgi:transporter family protein
VKTTGYPLGVVFALGAATAYGVNAILVKEGIQRFGIVLPGLVIAAVVGMLTLTPLALRSLPPSRPPARSIGLVLLSGLCAACGIGSYFLALSQLPVSVVVPVSSAYPLVTLIMARVFLRQSESITPRTIAGAVCVVAGVALIALTRGQ